MRFLLALFCCLLTLPATAAALRVDAGTTSVRLAPYVEVLEDPSGRLTIDQLRRPELAARFAPLASSGDANFGYSTSAWWLRVTLAPAAGTPPDWRLEVSFPTLDSVEFYPPAGAAQQAGDVLPFAARPLPHRNFVFPLQLADAPGEPQTIHLRVLSSGTMTVPLTLWSAPALHAADQDSYALQAIYYGMLLALGLYNLMLWFSLRDRSYLAYVAFVATMASGQLALSGLGFQYLWPQAMTWQAMSLNSGFAATGLFGAVFTRAFLDTRRHLPRLDRVILTLAAGFALTALAPLVAPYRPAAIATSLVGISFSVVAVLAGLLCLRRGDTGARFFLLAWLILLVGVALMGARNLAWLPTNWLTANGIQIGSAIEMLLLSFALADRIHLLRRDKESAQLAALDAKHAHIAALEASERELEAKVAQRTRELQESNTRLLASEATLRETAQRDPLTGLANRNVLFDRLQQAQRRGQRDGNGFAVMLIDLDNFKRINDTYGHGAGDEVLRVCAGRLRDAVRAGDTVCRLGGDELVVLLEAIASPEAARDIGAKVAAELCRPIAIGNDSAAVGASIGVALWPGRWNDAQSLLHAADLAMYRAKRQGRGCIEVASGGR